MKHYNIEKPIILMGDIHGQPKYMNQALQENNVTGSAIIILGDIGLGFYDNHAGCCKYLNSIGKEANNTFYIFRGNHDNPASFSDLNKEMIEKKYPNVVVLQDFDNISTSDGKQGIIVGGGISIDRQYRVVDKSYWRNELVDYSYIPDEHFDFVLAHSGPTPPSLSPNSPLFSKMITTDTGLVDIIAEEQNYFDRFIELVKPEHWYNGHYHWQGSESFEYHGTMVHVLGEASNETDAMGRSFMCEIV